MGKVVKIREAIKQLLAEGFEEIVERGKGSHRVFDMERTLSVMQFFPFIVMVIQSQRELYET